MDLRFVMAEVSGLLGMVPGLRVPDWPPGSVAPPAAVVAYPDSYRFGGGVSSGLDRIDIPIYVVVGKPTEQAALDNICRYCDKTGSHSIKQVLESATYTAFDTLRVSGFDFEPILIGKIEYMAAIATAEITGT